MPEPIEVPFWSKRDGIVARECTQCGHRGAFEFSQDPVMISSDVMCTACGGITFSAVLYDPMLEDATIEEIAAEAETVAQTEHGEVIVRD